jgi:hypothetical protein
MNSIVHHLDGAQSLHFHSIENSPPHDLVSGSFSIDRVYAM